MYLGLHILEIKLKIETKGSTVEIKQVSVDKTLLIIPFIEHECHIRTLSESFI